MLASASCRDRARSEPRAVIELFTSQGCSSCPAADKLLGELAQRSVAGRAEPPVDYWDYLGWKDTLGAARPYRAPARLRRCPRRPRGLHAAGGRERRCRRCSAATRRRSSRRLRRPAATPQPLDVPVTLTIDGDKVDRSACRPRRAIAAVAKSGSVRSPGKVPVEIGRGENRGKTLTYHNVVRRWVKLGDWNGKAADLQRAAQRCRGAPASTRLRCWCRAARREARRDARRGDDSPLR